MPVLNIQKDDLDKPDAIDPGQAFPGYRQRRDEPTKARMPWQVQLSLAVGFLLFVVFLLFVLYRFAAAWAAAHPDLIDLLGSLLWASAMLIIGVGVVSAAQYGRAKLAGVQARAKRELIIRDPLDNPINVDVLMDRAVALAIWQAQFNARQQAEVLMAPARRNVFVKTLSEGNHEEGSPVTVYGAGEEETPALPPPLVTLDSFPPSESPTAVPLGMDGADPIRLDFGGDTLHVGLYGASGAGKDNLLRAWFMALTRRNTPDQVCFAVLDGKGDWLTADLRDLAHMWIPPAGGAGQAGAQLMRAGIERIEAELVRRLTLVNGAGCRTREAYMQKTGASMPLLVVFITDGVTAVESALSGLMNDLVSKARAVGIRVVVSMQTPTGQDMRWRLNLSTYIAGHLPHPSQDLVALGLKAGELAIRPSQLPTPQQEPGLFIVRQGAMVKKVKAVYVPDAAFDDYVGRLAKRAAAPDPHAQLRAALRAMDELTRMRELRRLALLKGNTRTGWQYTTDELRDLFGMQQNKLVAIVAAIRSSANGVHARP